MPDPGAKRSMREGERFQAGSNVKTASGGTAYIGYGSGGAVTGEAFRQQQEKEAIEKQLQMSFATLEQAQSQLAKQQVKKEIERARVGERESLQTQRQEAFTKQLQATTPREKFQASLQAQRIEQQLRPQQTLQEQRDIFQQKIEQAKRESQTQQSQQQLSGREKLIYKTIPEAYEKYIKYKQPESFVSRRLVQPMGEFFLKDIPQKAVAVTSIFGKKNLLIPLVKEEAQAIYSSTETPEGRRELYIGAGIMGLTALTGAGVKAYKTYKQPQLKVEVSTRYIKEEEPVTKGARTFREKTSLNVYELKNNKWVLKENLPIENFYDTYGIKEIGIEPVIKGRAGVNFYTSEGKVVRGVFPKHALENVEATALGKEPSVSIGGIIIKREGQPIYTGEYIGSTRRLTKQEGYGRNVGYGFGLTRMGADEIVGAGISKRLVRVVKGEGAERQILDIGREIGFKKGEKVKAITGGEWYMKPYIPKPKYEPVSFLNPSKEVLKRISQKKYNIIPSEILETTAKRIIQPKIKYPKTISTISSITGMTIGREGIEELQKMKREEVPPLIYFEYEYPYQTKEAFYQAQPTEIVTAPKQIITPLTMSVTGLGLTTKHREKIEEKIKEQIREQIKEQIKQLPKERIKEQLREQQREMQRQMQRQKQLQRQVQREAVITTPKQATRIKPFGIPFLTSGATLKSALRKIKRLSGFELFVKTKGKFESFGVYPEAKAKRIGERIARETLSATFKLVPSKKVVVGGEEYFEPSPNIFRTYKISKGRHVKLPLTWIQRRGKRLSSFGEVSAIQKARKKKRSVWDLW